MTVQHFIDVYIRKNKQYNLLFTFVIIFLFLGSGKNEEENYHDNLSYVVYMSMTVTF